MASTEVDLTDVRYQLILNHEEAVALREILWFTQYGMKGKGRAISNIASSLDNAGLNPEKSDWRKELDSGKIIDLDSPEVGIYWV